MSVLNAASANPPPQTHCHRMLLLEQIKIRVADKAQSLNQALEIGLIFS